MQISQAVAKAARVAGARTATIEEGLRRSWAETGDRVARLAATLAMSGIAPGDRVAVLSDNGSAYFEIWFAIPWAGGVIVPLNCRLAPPELAFQLRDAGADILLFGREYEAVAQALLQRGAVKSIIAMDGDGPGVREALVTASAPLAEASAPGDLAGIFYTGGTTGLPKGVMLSHANLTAMASNLLAHIDFREGDVLFHAAPMFHLADIGTLFGTMAAGTHVFRRQLDAETMLADFVEHRVTHCFTVPTIIERLVSSSTSRGGRFDALRILGYGGAPMTAGSQAAARERFPNVGFCQGYGQTEFPAATILTPEDHRSGDPARLGSCGRACYGYDIRIVDEDGRECAPGEVGEIVGRGDNVMMGYWNRPEETAEVLRDGRIHTRDAGRMDENGYITITDRLKDMIVSAAENIYSIEVENALSWHPAVAEVAVVGLPDREWGERVHAIIALADGVPEPDARELAEFCRERIARYKVPKSFDLRREPLPRSAAGKILKRELRAEATGAGD
ncbi:MAG: long-chain fatty acid--CoA ligase [Sphingopyxis sp.]|uniref:acyl-CoA synthetase n=1 Tax=Sphingopyxis sp. TaxID=1908224 RepID=UPI001A4C9E0A|nr:long-chain fatty acid--CoA ligase [Sphingopyxis sp.]MBL9071395.1 long-chain fatty acid--CoA ligase [Sphingopyxis sp.]